MADLAAVHDLTFDSTSFQTDPIGVHVEITRGLNESPAVRGEDDVVASLAGRVSYPRLDDILAIEGEGVVLGSGSTVEDQQADYRAQILTIRTILAAGKLNPKTLSCVLEDGTTATIEARVVDYNVDEVVASLAAEIKIAWESVVPDWTLIAVP